MDIKTSEAMSHRVFDELRKYNDQFDPKVNYKPVTFYIEEDGEFVAGLEGCMAWDNFEIGNMVSLKKRQGLGRKLIEKVEVLCKENNLTTITAWTLDFQSPGFYEKCGFDLVAVVPKFAGAHACHHFIKRLK